MSNDQLRILLLRTDHRAELHVSGEVDWPDAEMLRDYVASLCDMGFERLLVDVREARFEDEALLRIVMSSTGACQASGVELTVRGEAA